MGECPLLSCFMIGVAQKSPGSPSAYSVFIVGKRTPSIYFQSSFNESKRPQELEALYRSAHGASPGMPAATGSMSISTPDLPGVTKHPGAHKA